MSPSCSRQPRLPRAGVDPITDERSALALLDAAADRFRHQTVLVVLDHRRCGLGIVVVADTFDRDAVVDIAARVLAPATHGGRIGAVVVASVRPDNADDADRNHADRNDADRNDADDTDRNDADRNHADRNHADRNHADRNDADRNDADRNDADRNDADAGVDLADAERWLELDEIAHACDVELVEWFVLGAGVSRPRDLVGAPPRW